MWEKIKSKLIGENVFNIISVFFLSFFTIFYGYRLIYYKGVFESHHDYSVNETLLNDKIDKTLVTSGNGLYNESGAYIYKGTVTNNYISFMNQLWRIIKINSDNTVEIVLDNTLNYMSYDNSNVSYLESNINKYLNDKYINLIDKSYLNNNYICLDTIDNINNITCNNKDFNNYVKLLDIKDYINSKVNNESYLDDSKVLLSNISNDKVWSINNKNISLDKVETIYKIKPVLLLRNNIRINGGSGTISDPFTISPSLYYGNYIKIDNDLYRIYDIENDNLKLVSNSTSYKTSFNTMNTTDFNNFTITTFINKKILSNLKYKDLLEECLWNYGEYNGDYTDMKSYKGKIGIPSIIDTNFSSKSDSYWTSNYRNSSAYVIKNNNIEYTYDYSINDIYYNICINKDKITSGIGTKDDPYIVGRDDK